MSAFAARQQLWGVSSASSTVEKAPEQSVKDVTQQRRSETPSTRSIPSHSRRRSVEESVSDSVNVGKRGLDLTTPQPESAVTAPIKQHSSFRPNKKHLQRKVGGRLVLTTPEAERLVILGSYGIKVREGEATIAGAILSASDDVQWVHAPHCHALPVLRTADDTVIELHPHPAAQGMRQLATLNPAFAKLWNETPSQEAGMGRAKYPWTFRIIYTPEDGPKRAILQELVSPAEWNKKISGLAAANRKATPVIFLCGPKSSGKSTFGRLVVNRLMTDRGGSKSKPWSSVFVLDLDPGQPEYAPPGIISLSKVTTPNLSPSFCHPTLGQTEGQIRAHAIASVTPALDPAYFIECALDLLAHYRRDLEASCPLVINTPGWIQGTGLDILCDLITAIWPTEVIYMSHDGPEETVASLQSACGSANNINKPIPFSTLPSQPADMSARTSLALRTMQMMSYFHLRPPDGDSPTTWDPTPLSALRPWRVRYTGSSSQRGFLGLVCYDHQPAPEMLAEAINGTVLALVRIESRAALRDLLPLPEAAAAALETTPTPADPLPSRPHSSADTGNAIPLIPNPLGRTLDPRHSRLLGLVLVRGVDTARGELQVLTPPSVGNAVGEVPGEELVLVAGRFDTPTWAYAEDLYKRAADVQRDGPGDGDGDDEGDDEGDGGDGESSGDEGRDGGRGEVPWVEMLHGSEKRVAGSKVWRVRRDLGRG
ncbi:Polynucleotide 5'-hydroxyl-kinase grc3 [Madurella fahalii]|uniref:Polynucleotide 5'-hydroxyl-kinase GRC3 n=1 Tax=Madurella fahalii TaxID=1157608 RepID=A0ABQ0GIH0_9PEZI